MISSAWLRMLFMTSTHPSDFVFSVAHWCPLSLPAELRVGRAYCEPEYQCQRDSHQRHYRKIKVAGLLATSVSIRFFLSVSRDWEIRLFESHCLMHFTVCSGLNAHSFWCVFNLAHFVYPFVKMVPMIPIWLGYRCPPLSYHLCCGFRTEIMGDIFTRRIAIVNQVVSCWFDINSVCRWKSTTACLVKYVLFAIEHICLNFCVCACRCDCLLFRGITTLTIIKSVENPPFAIPLRGILSVFD